jgi:DNA-binding PadR family transcriptional regulator
LEGEETIENTTFEEMRRRLIAHFLDVIVLRELTNRPMCGYDFVGLLSEKFYAAISSGTIYSTLYSMERKGLIEGGNLNTKRVYTLTPKGKEKLDIILKTKERILDSLQNILPGR